MHPDDILDRVRRTDEGLDILTTADAHYVYHDPERSTPHDKRQPFATIVLKDEVSDTASDLTRRGLFRLNIGVGRETYRAMFGPEPGWGPGGGVVATGHDFTQLDTWLPHPIYAPMSWICIVSPSDASWPRAKELLDEAYAKAKRSRRAPSVGGS